MWSKCAAANFHTTFVVCVSDAKYVAPSLFIIPGKRLNRDAPKGCNMEGSNIKTSPNVFINSNLFKSWIELFANLVPDSVARPILLVYDGCCSHYNDDFF